MIQGKDKGSWNKEIPFSIPFFQQLDQNAEFKQILKNTNKKKGVRDRSINERLKGFSLSYLRVIQLELWGANANSFFGCEQKRRKG